MSAGEPKLEIRFAPADDRQRHDIGIRHLEQDYPVLSSVEGDHRELWPPSPPLQEVVREQRPSGCVYLGVGKAGTSHWSASFQVLEKGQRIKIEHACRVSASPASLLHTYQLHRDWEARLFDANSIRLAHRLPPFHLTLSASGLTLQGDQIIVCPNEVGGPWPSTVFWEMDIQVGASS